MNLIQETFYIVTGGPGVGKTTLLEELKESRYLVVPEVARQIIKEQIARDGSGLPWKDKGLYAKLMLKASIDSYQSVLNSSPAAPIFFDRGILDTLCYVGMTGLGISKEMNKIASTYRYNQKVFILPPWPEIYQTDNERKQTWQEAELTFIKMKDTYLRYGYNVVEVPKDTVPNRRDFIIESLKQMGI